MLVFNEKCTTLLFVLPISWCPLLQCLGDQLPKWPSHLTWHDRVPLLQVSPCVANQNMTSYETDNDMYIQDITGFNEKCTLWILVWIRMLWFSMPVDVASIFTSILTLRTLQLISVPGFVNIHFSKIYCRNVFFSMAIEYLFLFSSSI